MKSIFLCAFALVAVESLCVKLHTTYTLRKDGVHVSFSIPEEYRTIELREKGIVLKVKAMRVGEGKSDKPVPWTRATAEDIGLPVAYQSDCSLSKDYPELDKMDPETTKMTAEEYKKVKCPDEDDDGLVYDTGKTVVDRILGIRNKHQGTLPMIDDGKGSSMVIRKVEKGPAKCDGCDLADNVISVPLHGTAVQTIILSNSEGYVRVKPKTLIHEVDPTVWLLIQHNSELLCATEGLGHGTIAHKPSCRAVPSGSFRSLLSPKHKLSDDCVHEASLNP